MLWRYDYFMEIRLHQFCNQVYLLEKVYMRRLQNNKIYLSNRSSYKNRGIYYNFVNVHKHNALNYLQNVKAGQHVFMFKKYHHFELSKDTF